MKKSLIVIAGPTACGKTESSVLLAKKINGEIISADSMQVYKYMDIGTAKINSDETQGIKHYLINEFYPDEDFSIAIFKEKATKYIQEIQSKGKIPILVGGTGFYINSVIYNNNFTETKKDDKYRKELEEIAINNGNDFLHNMLKNIDEKSANAIHKNNVKKVIRALEYYKLTGEKISTHNENEKAREQVYDTTFFVLNMDREKLYNRINLRVDMMIQNGLVEEVKSLLNKGYSKNLVSMQGLGYKEIIKYLEGEYSLDYAIEIIKRDTRHFAKRQITWFKHQTENAIWIDTNNFDNAQDLSNYMKDIFINKGE
ncbi:tRNA (adenosine(37)-N6)-dimethylallyltransferase MiaA [[Clostridium] colinum]|uniref:tRNA (adenosine(37)-N6)-dimethylallyltransferase MiaA n=1 Tax=[Clostridium] colinum TaxID=36835 RepID=UPI0020252FD9|nr:tRNA (adenosine(37)-N6)-dimethylallyltransferase MiaA [[Clostridium] colinum]